ncbi:unnamed protein product, partial [marine sediment metagenome]
MGVLPQLSESTLDSICRSLAEAVTHKELTLLLTQCGIDERDGNPRWERMLLALLRRQQQDQCGNNA